jgi:hypothetical protein
LRPVPERISLSERHRQRGRPQPIAQSNARVPYSQPQHSLTRDPRAAQKSFNLSIAETLFLLLSGNLAACV